MIIHRVRNGINCTTDNFDYSLQQLQCRGKINDSQHRLLQSATRIDLCKSVANTMQLEQMFQIIVCLKLKQSARVAKCLRYAKHMGQFLQGGNFGCFASLFLNCLVERLCDTDQT